MKFVVVDVETANSNVKSICQIGIAVFENGLVIDKWSSLVNPQDYFDFLNVGIHGITERKVRNSPKIQDLKEIIQKYFSLGTVCSYSLFDRNALTKNFDDFNYQWLDIMKVVRTTWNEAAYSGYGLSSISDFLGIDLENHHDALNDAIVAGHILNKALDVSKLDLDALLKMTKRPISDLRNLKATGVIVDGGNPEGAWFGEVLVFTGELSIPRMTASILASQHGFNVMKGVTKKTTFLIKGFQDQAKLNGAEMSDKEQKALGHIKKGRDIVFLSEDDFFKLINETQE